MREATLVITFGVDFLRNFLLQSNMKKPPWHWHWDLDNTVVCACVDFSPSDH